jgi:hypothetical protein
MRKTLSELLGSLAIATLSAACSGSGDAQDPPVCGYADSSANCPAPCASGDYAWPDGAVSFVCAYGNPASEPSLPCPPPSIADDDGEVITVPGSGGPLCSSPSLCVSSDRLNCLQDSGCTWTCVTPMDAGH